MIETADVWLTFLFALLIVGGRSTETASSSHGPINAHDILINRVDLDRIKLILTPPGHPTQERVDWAPPPMAAAEGKMAAAGIGLGPSAGKTKGLDCPICFEAYGSSCHVPMVLSCGHTLCEDCVEKNRRGGDKVSQSVGRSIGRSVASSRPARPARPPPGPSEASMGRG